VFDLVTAGEAFDDLIFYALDRLPNDGEELKTQACSRSPGGGAVITAVAAARLGLRTAVVSAVSDDGLRMLRAEGIAVRNLRRRDEAAALTVALSSRRDRRFLTFNGVNDALPDRIRRLLPRVRGRHVHLAFYPRPCRPWIAVIDQLRRRGVTSSWDFGWNPRLIHDPQFRTLAESVDCLFLNRDEALMYSRRTNLRDALDRWRRSPSPVVVKLGRLGSVIVGGGIELRAAAVRARAVETTGAGDAFNGGFLVAALRGDSLRAALRLGNRIGALSTRRPGGIAGLPRDRSAKAFALRTRSAGAFALRTRSAEAFALRTRSAEAFARRRQR
jgi:sugar/nucleoside kinase (ribokinase family)